MALQGHNRGPGGGGGVSGWIGLGDGFGSPRLGVGDMARISYHNYLFLNITIHDFITILCHVGFSILQVI